MVDAEEGEVAEIDAGVAAEAEVAPKSDTSWGGGSETAARRSGGAETAARRSGGAETAARRSGGAETAARRSSGLRLLANEAEA